MITPDLLEDLHRLADAGAFRAPMLMLGAQECLIPGFKRAHDWFRMHVGKDYEQLDMADGDITADLNHDLSSLAGRYGCVFNLGTIEHVWDQHRAWSNALRAVALGGTFVTHSPVGGWTDQRGCFNHGLQMTRVEGIAEFLELNGFRVQDWWLTRFRDRGMVYWAWATKERQQNKLEDFKPIYRIRGMSPIYRSKP